MKILLVNKFYYLSGGAERYVQLWTRLLRERGHEVIPFAMRDPRNWPTPYARYFARPVYFDAASEPESHPTSGRVRRSVERAWAAARSLYSLDAARRISRLVRDTRPDIAHVHSYGFQLTSSILSALRAARVPVIQTAHEYKHICPNQHLYNQRTGEICALCGDGAWYAPITTGCLKGSRAAGAVAVMESFIDRELALRRHGIDRVIAPSRFMRDMLLDCGWPSARVSHIPNFVFPGDFDPTREAEPYFLFAGRWVRHKGVLTLIRAMRELPDAKLVIAGDGPLHSEVKNLAQEQANRITIVGFRDGAELRDLLERCLAAIVPSEWYENCPYAVLEAMAAGRAVVASRIGGNPELIANGSNGLLFTAGDKRGLVEKMAFLWQHRDEAARMGAAGRSLIERRYSPGAHYDAITEIMRGLTA